MKQDKGFKIKNYLITLLFMMFTFLYVYDVNSANDVFSTKMIKMIERIFDSNGNMNVPGNVNIEGNLTVNDEPVSGSYLTSTTVTDSVANTETIALTSGYKEYDIHLTQTTDATGAVYLPEQAGMETDAIAYIYNAGTFAATFPFSSGVQEFNGGEAGDYLQIYAGGHLTFRYTGTRWVCISNEGSKQYFSTFTTTETDFIPIAYMNDGTSAPAEAALVTSTNSALCRAFDGASNEDGKIVWKIPPDIDATQGIKFQIVGKVGSATAPAEGEVIAFSLAGMSVGNSDILSGAVGTPQTSSLTAAAGYVQYDEITTTFSPAIAVTNLAAGETAHLDLIRLAESTDTYAQDFHPYGINIKYVRLHNATF